MKYIYKNMTNTFSYFEWEGN